MSENKNTIKEVLNIIKEELPLNLVVKEYPEILVTNISDIEVKYKLYNDDDSVEEEVRTMPLRQFRMDLIRFNRDLVDYITSRI